MLGRVRSLLEVSQESEKRPDATAEWECKATGAPELNGVHTSYAGTARHGTVRRSAAQRAYETPLLVSGISQNTTINKQTHRIGGGEREREREKEKEREREKKGSGAGGRGYLARV